MNLSVIIDVFRAFTTACYVLEQNPVSYKITNQCSVVSKLSSLTTSSFLIGKPELDSNIVYNIPNSPLRVKESNITLNNVIHRTQAGSKGILDAFESDIILAASFVNAKATVKYIKKINSNKLKIVPMGHEANSPSLEDELCALYIQNLLNDNNIALPNLLTQLKQESGKYFFQKDQWQYPQEDFLICLQKDIFDFAINADLCESNYAILTKLPIDKM